jgi:hypothetical protein
MASTKLRQLADDLCGEEVRKSAKWLVFAGICLATAGARLERWINK